MAAPHPDVDRLWFVEEFQALWRLGGASVTEGRVLGLLLVTRRPSLTARDLCTALGVSTGSVSEVTRRLEVLRLIRRLRVPGDRRHHFTADDDVWGSFLGGERPLLLEQRDLAARGLADLGLAADEQARVRLANMRDYMGWIAAHHREMLAEWTRFRDRLDRDGDRD